MKEDLIPGEQKEDVERKKPQIETKSLGKVKMLKA